MAALKFFLGQDEEEAEEEPLDSEEERDAEMEQANRKNARTLMFANKVAKKSRKRTKQVEKALNVLKVWSNA